MAAQGCRELTRPLAWVRLEEIVAAHRQVEAELAVRVAPIGF
jgi:hypothetical protein